MSSVRVAQSSCYGLGSWCWKHPRRYLESCAHSGAGASPGREGRAGVLPTSLVHWLGDPRQVLLWDSGLWFLVWFGFCSLRNGAGNTCLAEAPRTKLIVPGINSHPVSARFFWSPEEEKERSDTAPRVPARPGRPRHSQAELWAGHLAGHESCRPPAGRCSRQASFARLRECGLGQLLGTGVVQICAVAGMVAAPVVCGGGEVFWETQLLTHVEAGPARLSLLFPPLPLMPGPACQAAPSPPVPRPGWSGGTSPRPGTAQGPLPRSVCWCLLRREYFPLGRHHRNFQ